MSQSPEMPTAWPLALIAVAADVESPGNGGSCCIVPLFGSHMTARNWRTWGELQVGSCTGVSAHPTTWPRLLTPVAKPWLPPSVGSGVITPSSDTKPRQIRPVTEGKNAVQLHSSPSGSMSAVSAMPTTVPWSFNPGHTTLLFGPPSVPRSRIDPPRHRAAWRVWFPGRLEKPATRPRLLMAVPRFTVPPSDDENAVISYCGLGARGGGGAPGGRWAVT